MPDPCPVCGTPVPPPPPGYRGQRRVYCSRPCQAGAYDRRRRAARAAERERKKRRGRPCPAADPRVQELAAVVLECVNAFPDGVVVRACDGDTSSLHAWAKKALDGCGFATAWVKTT